MPHYLSERGYFINRDWTKYILEKDWTFEKYERKMNGTIYFYILKNDKKWKMIKNNYIRMINILFKNKKIF